MKAILYCRVSSEEQVKNLSLGSQEKACRELCARHGWEVDRVFVEEGESGKTADRSMLLAALEHCRRHRREIAHFVVYDVNRLARNSRDHHNLRYGLGRLGISLRAVTLPSVEETPEAKLVESMLADFAEYDNASRARATRRGMRAALERGRWVWQPPAGYRMARASDGSPAGLEPSDTAEAISRAFTEVAAGDAVSVVAERLQAAGIRGARGGPLSEQTLHRILRNPLYRGRIMMPEWGIDLEGAHEPLVDQVTWGRVQRRLEPEPRIAVRTYRRGNPDFPLGSGVASCTCERPLTGSWAKGRTRRYPYYRCYSCRWQARRESVEDQVEELLETMQPTPQALDWLRVAVEEASAELAGSETGRLERLAAQLEAVQQRRQRLIDAYVFDRALTLEDYRPRLDRLTREADDLELQLAECREEHPALEDLLDFATAALTRLRHTWSMASGNHRRQLAVGIFPAGIYLYRGKIQTALTSSLFNALRPAKPLDPRVVPPTGPDANLLADLVALRSALGGTEHLWIK